MPCLADPGRNYVQRSPTAASNASSKNEPGAFAMGPDTASMWNSYFTFIAYTSPLLGAYVADQYLGKFKVDAIPCTRADNARPLSSLPRFIASAGLSLRGLPSQLHTCQTRLPFTRTLLTHSTLSLSL